MKLHLFVLPLLAAGIIFGSTAYSDEAPKAQKTEARQKMRDRGKRRPMNMPNPMMHAVRKAAKELKAYQANPTADNFAAFEKTFNEAVKSDTARQKALLEKQLAELEKNQAERAKQVLAKVKSGEFKFPERPERGKAPRARGPRARRPMTPITE